MIPAFDNRLLVMQGWGYITLFVHPQGVALLEKVARLRAFVLDVIVISVGRRALSHVRSTSTGKSWCVASFGVFRLT